jgi:hypothetical protein
VNYEIAGAHDSGGTTRAFLILDCADKCSIPLVHGGPRMGESKVWGWDGNTTVTPSINCSKCGFHKTLVNGEWK